MQLAAEHEGNIIDWGVEEVPMLSSIYKVFPAYIDVNGIAPYTPATPHLNLKSKSNVSCFVLCGLTLLRGNIDPLKLAMGSYRCWG
jgi:hypothetical protein